MEYIQIPVPDFSFSNVVKLKAKRMIESRLAESSITHGYARQTEETYLQIKSVFYDLNSREDKMVFISELLNYVSNTKQVFKGKNLRIEILISGEAKFNDLQHFLYDILNTIIDINLGQETFTDEDVNSLNRKINAILIKLDEIQVGNEVIFDEVEELKIKLKEDFESLKSDYPLGKKRWYQRATGVVVSYAGTKGADEVYGQLKPLLHDFFVNHAPHIIDKL